MHIDLYRERNVQKLLWNREHSLNKMALPGKGWPTFCADGNILGTTVEISLQMQSFKRKNVGTYVNVSTFVF